MRTICISAVYLRYGREGAHSAAADDIKATAATIYLLGGWLTVEVRYGWHGTYFVDGGGSDFFTPR